MGVSTIRLLGFFLVQVVDKMVEHCRRSCNHVFNSWDLGKGKKNNCVVSALKSGSSCIVTWLWQGFVRIPLLCLEPEPGFLKVQALRPQFPS